MWINPQRQITPISRPVAAAAAASFVSVALVAIAIWWTGRRTGIFLVWNLGLAWLPLLFATRAERPSISRRQRWLWSVLWLLFFPNAPYIFTDLIHVGPQRTPEYWVELGMVLLFALTGLVVGFLSLDRMQRLVTRYYGRLAGWAVVGLSSVLGAVGVAVGRFLRWNSWDAWMHPWELMVDVGGWLYDLPANRHAALFLALFALFLFLGYTMFHAVSSGRAENPALQDD